MVNKITNIKQRVVQFAEKQSISKEEFFKRIGMTSANFRGKAQNSPLNSSTIENIISEFPEINLHWLVTGKGNATNELPGKRIQSFTLRTDTEIHHQTIPIYNLEATAGLVELFRDHSELEAVDTMSIPNLPKCDGAVFVAGDSMYPLLKSGDIIMYKKINDLQNDIYWGQMYLISVAVDDEEFVMVKYLQKSEKGEKYLKLVSENRHHQDKDVLLEKVRALALIKASVRVNTMN